MVLQANEEIGDVNEIDKAKSLPNSPRKPMVIDSKEENGEVENKGKQATLDAESDCPGDNVQDIIVSAEIILDHPQLLHSKITPNKNSVPFYVTTIYAASDPSDRKNLWASFCSIADDMLPWLVLGDFNCVADHDEYIGCKTQRGLEDFTDCIASCPLVDAGYIGSKYTWTRVRKFKRLDRVLTNHGFLDKFISIGVRHLTRTASDHAPLLVDCRSSTDPPKSSFRFQNMWLQHEEFRQVVTLNWQLRMPGDPIHSLWFKLKRLKSKLKEWNKLTFGNIFTQIEQVKDEVACLERIVETSDTPSDVEALNKAKAKHLRCLALEEEFWSQQCGIRWIKEGDRSTSFFHSYAKKKRKRSYITGTLVDGEWITDKATMSSSAVEYFKHLCHSEEQEIDETLFEDCIPTLADQQDNAMLTNIPTLEEIKDAVFSLDKACAAGADGFNGVFFQTFWEVIGVDMHQAIAHFFRGHQLPQGITSTVLCLIPKCQGAKTWKEYRPISLCTFLNNVITKVLNSRLARLLAKLVSEFQAGFVKGRAIQDNILLVQELTHCIDKQQGGGNVIMKLDMTKAFDRLSWKFLKMVLRKFGFSESWINLIMGDPLSPALFILAEEYLLGGLNKLIQEHPEVSFNGGGPVKVPCLAFADDCIVFCNGLQSSVKSVMDWLNHYQHISRQLINTEKSTCILSAKLSPTRANMVTRSTGFKRESLPFTYLGVPKTLLLV
ncbi:hypothetical protein LIER_14134 [Lithospermum erythrorhizon]|uniref:Reverse transcriptase domain-containing protein n=1 Tax=Lithospermum erythrorhizon TaxID=34254 RepID=A0AAV3Q0I3_LITER